MAAKRTMTILNWLETILVSPVLLYRYLRFGYTYRRIYLGEGQYTKLDSADYYRLRDYRWYLTGMNGKFYVVRAEKVGNNRTKIKSMQREIIRPPKGKVVDHRNCDAQDNRRANLRSATRSENMMNRRKTSSKTSSKYIGVFRDKNRKKWTTRLRCKGKVVFCRQFDKEIEAAKARDEAVKKYRIDFARLNFPEPERTPISRIVGGVKGIWGYVHPVR
jgi:hypothetical protein